MRSDNQKRNRKRSHAVGFAVLFLLVIQLSMFFLWDHEKEAGSVAPTCQEIVPGELFLRERTNQSAISEVKSRPMNPEKSICFWDSSWLLHQHLPHAMQWIYRCWTIWEKYPGDKVLLKNPDDWKVTVARYLTKIFNPYSKGDFINGMLSAMEEAFNVKIILSNEISEYDRQYAIDATTEQCGGNHCMRRQDAWKWTEGILRHENLHEERIGCKGPVRIGILNRAPDNGRSILNAKRIMDTLRHEYGPNVRVDEITMDGKSFREQIGWFASHDIIFTGHGAQETSLPFMARCGVVMEIFPFGYYVPHKFGSLADSTHVRHYSMYDNNMTDPIADTLAKIDRYADRVKVRAENFCPAAASILQYISTAVRDWELCCKDVEESFNFTVGDSTFVK
jgi:hypothetical protein